MSVVTYAAAKNREISYKLKSGCVIIKKMRKLLMLYSKLSYKQILRRISKKNLLTLSKIAKKKVN